MGSSSAILKSKCLGPYCERNIAIKSLWQVVLNGVPAMSDYNPLSTIPPSRKRKPAQKLIDENNVAKPALKQQRLTLEQQYPDRSPHHVPDPMDRNDSDSPSDIISSSCPSAPATVIVSTDDEDEEDMEDILTEFVPKKRGEQKGLKKKVEGETAEEELGE